MTDRIENSTRHRDRYSALFQRVDRPSVNGTPTTIYGDLVTHLRFHPADLRHAAETFGSHSPLAAAVSFLEACGFTREEIVELRFGLYPSPEEVRAYLRRVGYSDAAVTESGLVCDSAGHAHTDWHGCVVVPVHDRQGQVVDVAVIPPTSATTHHRFACGPERSGVPVVGCHTAAAQPEDFAHLFLVEDATDALYLQCRGLPNVVAVGGHGGSFTSQRWQQLAQAGVQTVTLAFRHDVTCRRDIRDCLDHALHARTAPEVFVLDHDQLGGQQTLADVARRHGIEACRQVAEQRVRAFHGKAFGWTQPVAESIRRPVVESVPQPTSLRTWLVAEADRLADPEDRRSMHDLIHDVDDALRRGHYKLAHDLVESRLGTARTEQPAVGGSVGSVLDRLTRGDDRGRVDREFLPHDGSERHAGTVTVLSNSSRRGRFSELCARVAHGLERWTGTTCVVVCQEFTEEEITLGVVAHMTRRLSDGHGLTVEEIRTRLAGHDPRTGYSDKPWLVDEAVDRLRQWSDRLQFVRAEHAVAAVAADHVVGTVFVDHRSTFAMADLEAIAQRFRCPVVVVTSDMVSTVREPEPAPYRVSGGHWDFSAALHEWVEQDERQTRRRTA